MTPCDASDDCLHHECLDCHRPLRRKGEPLADHPGTISGFTKRRLCETHYLARQKPAPKPHHADVFHQHNVRNLNNFMARIRGTSNMKVGHRG